MDNNIPNFISKNTLLPLFNAPMFLVSGVDMVVESCINGIIGSFPLPNARDIETLNDWFDKITFRIEKEKQLHPNKKIAPFAVNLNVHKSYSRFDEEMELIMKYKPKIVLTALGSPARVIEKVHSYGGIVISDVNSVPYAKKAAAAGADGLVLVVSGAGGHAGEMSAFAMVDEVKKFYNGLVILSGAISTGRGILSAQCLGADLVFMGSRFIPTYESLAPQEYKEMIVNSSKEDLILTDAFSGVNCNMLIPSIENAGLKISELRTKEKIDFSNMNGGKAWKKIWSAGHGIGSIDKIESIKDIVEGLVKDYKANINKISKNKWVNIHS